MITDEIDVRPFRLELEKYFKDKELIGVEIGTCAGENALGYLQHIKFKKLYLIDPYIEYYDGNKTRGTFWLRKTRLGMKEKLKEYKEEYIHIMKLSEDATNDVPNDLDFVYIDGNHTYEYVKKDIELWYPKVKNKGILGGHDYTERFPDVVRAVNEFKDKFKLDLKTEDYRALTCKNDQGWVPACEWWIYKNE